MPKPSGRTKTSPLRFMTHKVSWDPNVTVVEGNSRQRKKNCAPSGPSSPQSRRAPHRPSLLHPLLAPGTTPVILDARIAPAATLSRTLAHVAAEPATASGAQRLRLVSREFPWTISVEGTVPGATVTCADVLSALYAGLSTPITAAEWTLADADRRESMKRANRNRRGGGSVRRLRRVDWLGSRVYFMGMSCDEGLCRERLLPEDELWPDTWVVKFGSR